MISHNYLKQIENYYNKNDLCIILIDGYACTGKTTLANNLFKYFNKKNILITLISKDLFLYDRSKRDDITKLNKKIINQNTLHYDNKKFDKLIFDIFSFYSSDNYEKSLKKTLRNLYDRSSGHRNNKIEYKFKSKQLIIIEGLYLLHNHLLNNCNFKFFLSANKKQILANKYARKNKNKFLIQNELENIHFPSMDNYIYYNINKFNQIYNFSNHSYRTLKNIERKTLNNIHLNNNLQSLTIKKLSFLIIDINLQIKRRIINKIELSNTNLNKSINTIIKNINSKYKTIFEINIIYIKGFNNFINYFPIPLLLSVTNKSDYTRIVLNFEFFVDNFFLNLKILYNTFNFEFKYDQKFELVFKKLILAKNVITKTNIKLNVITPADLLIPSFVNNISSKNIIYTGIEDKSFYFISILKKLENNETIIIQRITLFKDILNFKKLFIDFGYFVSIVGNYLIVLNSNKRNLINKFQKFYSDWFTIDKYLYNFDYKKHDLFIIKERKDLRSFSKKLKNLKLFDNYFRITNNNKSEINLDIKKCLLSNQRLVRKRACQLIFELYPNLKINLKKIYPKHFNNTDQIDFDDYIEISPTIMSEIFLWLSIKSNKSSILACNIYDLGKNGLDTRAHLENSSLNSTPIILQGSLNALGPINNERKPSGYLHLDNGFNKLKDLSKINGLKIFKNSQKIPFFGIAIDHLSLNYDIPKGRALNFFQNALNSGYLTHVTLDAGDMLYDIRKNIEKITDYYSYILKNKKLSFIVDKEIIMSGLDYPENQSENKISSINELLKFMSSLQIKFRLKNLNEINTRPNLFVGNLGTTHHGMDKMVPKIKISVDWKNSLKKYNYVSAVLHGTTKTEPFYLKESSLGCHKINVAGDLLSMFINSLPNNIFKSFESHKDPKYILSNQRKKIDQLSLNDRSKVIKNMYNLSKNFSNLINSPSLSYRDKSFFKYNFYSFNNLEISEIHNNIDKLSINNKQSLDKYNKNIYIYKIDNFSLLNKAKLSKEFLFEINNNSNMSNLVFKKEKYLKNGYVYFNHKFSFEKSIHSFSMIDQLYTMGFSNLIFDLDAFNEISEINNLIRFFLKKNLKISFNISNFTFKKNFQLLRYVLINNNNFIMLSSPKYSKNNPTENYFDKDLYSVFIKSTNVIRELKSKTKVIVNLSDNIKIGHNIFINNGAYRIITNYNDNNKT